MEHRFCRFIRPLGAPPRGNGPRMDDRRHPRHPRRLLSAVAAFACCSVTLSCTLASLASLPAASVIQTY